MNTTAIDLDAILARVQKLLNVRGRDPEEAAQYVAKAHAILAEYDLSIDDIGALKSDPRTAVAQSVTVASTTTGKPDGWKADLLGAVARAFECRVTTTWEHETTKSGKSRYVKHHALIGFGHDLEAAHYAQSFLTNEIARLAKEHSRPMWDAIKANAKSYGISVHEAEADYTRWNGTHPLKAELYFIKGAAETVVAAMRVEARERKAKQQADNNPNALVVLKSAEIDDYVGRRTYRDEWPAVKARRAVEMEAHRKQAEAQNAIRSDHQQGAHDEQANLSCTLCNREAAERKERPESPSAARRRAAAEERQSKRAWDRHDREQAKIDHSALRAGREAGRGISIRPGVKPGSSSKEQIGG